MKTLTLLFALATIFALQTFAYYPPDSCLKVVQYDFSTDPMRDAEDYPNYLDEQNQFRVKCDSCENSQTYLDLYAQKFFLIELESQKYPFDTIYQWYDSAYIENIKNDEVFAAFKQGFIEIENKHGNLRFYGHHPKNVPDPYDLDPEFLVERPIIIITFIDNYVNVDSVLKDLFELPYIKDSVSVIARLHLDIGGWHTSVDDNTKEMKNLLYNSVVDHSLLIMDDFHLNRAYKVISIEGIVMQQGKIESNIGIQNLPRGTYIFLIEEQNIFQKFVKM